MKNVAIIYNASHRKDTTGSYCLKALIEMTSVGVAHYTPGEAITEDYDVHLVIDDGIPFEWRYIEGKKNLCYWAIDTHLGFNERFINAHNCDKVFVAQKNDAERFKANGLPAVWLPLGCDLDTHSNNLIVRKEYDVCFVGHTDPKFMEKRINYLDALFRAFPVFFYGQRYFREATEIYAKSKIVFNCSVKNDINMRCFEAIASGSLLLTDKIEDNGFEDLFTNGVHCVTYNSVEDMLEKAKYYLENDGERERIAKAGQKVVKELHTYKNRMYRLLAEMDIHGG